MISIGFASPNITASIINAKSGEFEASVSILKNQKFTWNPTEKHWEKSAILYNDNLYDTLKLVTDVYFPEPIKELIKGYSDSLPSELVVENEIEKIDYEELIHSPFKPIVGKAPFENFQDVDIRRALKQNRFLFNWDMGCGKSFATAVIYEYLRKYKNIEKMILLTSRIGTFNLQDELEKFCLHIIPDQDIQVFNSPKTFKKIGRKVFDNEDVCNKKVLVFSYDSWKLVASAYNDKSKTRSTVVPLEKFIGSSTTEALICLDECHYLANPKSERSKLLFKYLKNFKYRYLFSATPASKYEKLYSVCCMLDPKLVRYLKYNEWINKYNDVGTYFSKYAINKNGWHEDEIAELNQELAKYSAKRVAKDVLNLPEYTVKTFYVKMSEKQEKLYQEVTNDIVNNCTKKSPDLDENSVDIIREAFTTVMSFVENPEVLATSPTQNLSKGLKEACSKYRYDLDYAKLDVVDAILEDEFENNNRGIIWYLHPKTMEVLAKKYANYNPVYIVAGMTEDERSQALNEFRRNSNHKVLIASQNVLSTSVTLTECTFAVYLETSFSWETYHQSTGRIYRIGQTDPVRIYHIWLKDTVDIFHAKALDDKRDLSSYLFSSKEKPSLSISLMKKLFTGDL